MGFIALQIVLCLALAVPAVAVTGGLRRPRVWLRMLSAAVAAQCLQTLGLIFVGGYYSFYQVFPAAPFLLKYAGLSLVIGAAVQAGVVWLIRGGCLRDDQRRWRWWEYLLAVLTVLLTAAAGTVYFVARWFHVYFGDIGGDHLIFLLTSGTGESTDDVSYQITHYMVVPVVIVTIGALLIATVHSRFGKGKGVSARAVRGTAGVLAVAMLAGSAGYAYAVLPIQDIIDSRTPSNWFEDNYVEPTSDNVHPGEHQRNLVHILMESVENSYYDKAQGGYMETNLMPGLAELTRQNVSFSNNDVFGGPHQTTGAGHSIAAIINMWAGVPLKDDGARVPEAPGGYPHYTALGDILKSWGYQTEWMMGADASWGHLDTYFPSHGIDTMFDHQYAIDEGLVPADYSVWWGFEDDKLYDYAKTEMTRLAATGDPFYLTIENADTHFPDGYLSPNATERVSDQQYGNVIHYSQAEVVNLVEWIQDQPFGADTTIVITGDHQSMDQTFFAGWDKSYERTTVNAIINGVPGTPGSEQMHDRQFAPFDFFPTILVATGAQIDGDRLGLGTNLYSGRPTLVERDGLDTVNREINKFSRYYHLHTEVGFTR